MCALDANTQYQLTCHRPGQHYWTYSTGVKTDIETIYHYTAVWWI